MMLSKEEKRAIGNIAEKWIDRIADELVKYGFKVSCYRLFHEQDEKYIAELIIKIERGKGRKDFIDMLRIVEQNNKMEISADD